MKYMKKVINDVIARYCDRAMGHGIQIVGRTERRLTLLALICATQITCAQGPHDHQNTLSDMIPTSEYDALVDIYNSLGGSGWRDNTAWLDDTTPNTSPSWVPWTGVTWDGVVYETPWVGSKIIEKGNVTGLWLHQQNLTGRIPSSLSALTKLQTLHIVGGSHEQANLVGGIPSFIGGLSELRILIIRYTNLGGEIPSSIGNLTRLELLHLQDNNLSGSIPSSFASLSSLSSLILNERDIFGDFGPSFGNLSASEYFDVSSCSLYGSIPDAVHGWSELSYFDVSDNQLKDYTQGTNWVAMKSALTNREVIVEDDYQLHRKGGTITDLHGDVYVDRPTLLSTTNCETLVYIPTKGFDIHENDLLWAVDGYIRVDLFGGSHITLGAPARVKIVRSDREQRQPSVLKLLTGWLKSVFVPSDASSKVKMFIYTRTVAVGVRGTEFEMTFDDFHPTYRTTVGMHTGQVDTTSLVYGDVTTVTNGQTWTNVTVLTDGADAVLSAISQAGLVGIDAGTGSTPHSDGIDNLMKYAFNLDLSSHDGRHLRVGMNDAKGLPGIQHVVSNQQRHVVLEYLKRRDGTVAYRPRYADMLLGQWAPLTQASRIDVIDADWERVTHDFPMTNDQKSLFFAVETELQ